MRLPTKREIIPPINGWKESTYYIVEASFTSGNPITKYMYYSGFLNNLDKTPEAYNLFLNLEDVNRISDVFYMKVLFQIADTDLNPRVIDVAKIKENNSQVFEK